MWGSESRIGALVEKGAPFVERIHKMDPNGFSQLPLRRFEHLTPAKGQRQEETIKAIWAERECVCAK